MSGEPGENHPEEYLMIIQLSKRIGYAPQTIRNLISQGVFQLGKHYIKPLGRVLFIWSRIVEWLNGRSAPPDIPLTRGP